MQRVICLYRVSTLGQVEKDDIPMQRQACCAFAKQQGWDIIKEYVEKGVSGFKVSANDRDAIQEIRGQAAQRSFDVLLVFMFDRIGRRDDETPFVVQSLVQSGIEVWSVCEGQQKFDSHVDKLMNYIRYWQASGESIKTSIRTKTRLSQLVQEGRYRGGTVPLGYRLEKQGRTNKKNHEVYEIVVDEQQAKIVQTIFDKYVLEGYGAQRICRYLTEMHLLGEREAHMTNSTIQRILKNRVYLGILKNGDTESGIFPHLQIITSAQFMQAQELMQQRSHHSATSTLPFNIRGKALLSGNIFCAHCGARLILTTSVRKYKRKDGTVYEKRLVRYTCYNRSRHPQLCDGQTGYLSEKIDAVVEQLIRSRLDWLLQIPKERFVYERSQKELELLEQRRSEVREKLVRCQALQREYGREILAVMRGESAFSSARLEARICEAEADARGLAETIYLLTAEIQDIHTLRTRMQNQYETLQSWSEAFTSGSLEAKKMIAARLMTVRVGRGYAIAFELVEEYRFLKG